MDRLHSTFGESPFEIDEPEAIDADATKIEFKIECDAIDARLRYDSIVEF